MKHIRITGEVDGEPALLRQFLQHSMLVIKAGRSECLYGEKVAHLADNPKVQEQLGAYVMRIFPDCEILMGPNSLDALEERVAAVESMVKGFKGELQ